MYVHHIALTVKNLTESVKFYTELFGFHQVKQFRKGNAEIAHLELDGLQLELLEFTPVKEGTDLKTLAQIGIRHIAFGVTDLDEAVANAKKYHVIFDEPQMGAAGRRYSFGEDCNGIMLELIEVKERIIGC